LLWFYQSVPVSYLWYQAGVYWEFSWVFVFESKAIFKKVSRKCKQRISDVSNDETAIWLQAFSGSREFNTSINRIGLGCSISYLYAHAQATYSVPKNLGHHPRITTTSPPMISSRSALENKGLPMVMDIHTWISVIPCWSMSSDGNESCQSYAHKALTHSLTITSLNFPKGGILCIRCSHNVIEESY
jgi:hypothetical protein